MPWLLSTGDDDGVVKVRIISYHLKKSAGDALFSFGILGSATVYGHTRNILIISQIFFG
jgi:hypothetical protein